MMNPSKSPPVLRKADKDDAEDLASVLHALIAAGKRSKPGDAAFALSHYLAHPDQIVCTLALDQQNKVLGFQSLKRAVEDNPYGAPVGWGVIGTHIRPSAARKGIGRALFQETLKAAKSQSLPAIDATIGATNAEGLGYYKAMGFRAYRSNDGAISKVFRLG